MSEKPAGQDTADAVAEALAFFENPRPYAPTSEAHKFGRLVSAEVRRLQAEVTARDLLIELKDERLARLRSAGGPPTVTPARNGNSGDVTDALLREALEAFMATDSTLTTTCDRMLREIASEGGRGAPLARAVLLARVALSAAGGPTDEQQKNLG